MKHRILEESPRWLASQGMENEARNGLERISVINKKEILIKGSIRFDVRYFSHYSPLKHDSDLLKFNSQFL